MAGQTSASPRSGSRSGNRADTRTRSGAASGKTPARGVRIRRNPFGRPPRRQGRPGQELGRPRSEGCLRVVQDWQSTPPRHEPSPIVTAAKGIGRGLLRIWTLVARWLGGLVRAIGRGAAATRDIDAVHRRDGIALGLIALAVVCAIGTWLQAAGPVGGLAEDAVRVWIGVAGGDLPDRPRGGRRHADAHRTRPSAAAAAHRRRSRVTVAIVGILHVLHVNALPDCAVDSIGLRMSAGGTLGWVVGQPLYVGVTAIPAIILLVLLGLFGGLLVSGVPLVEVPRRTRDGIQPAGPAARLDHDDDRSPATPHGGDYRDGGEVDARRGPGHGHHPAPPAVPTPAGAAPGRAVEADLDDPAGADPSRGAHHAAGAARPASRPR